MDNYVHDGYRTHLCGVISTIPIPTGPMNSFLYEKTLLSNFPDLMANFISL